MKRKKNTPLLLPGMRLPLALSIGGLALGAFVAVQAGAPVCAACRVPDHLQQHVHGQSEPAHVERPAQGGRLQMAHPVTERSSRVLF